MVSFTHGYPPNEVKTPDKFIKAYEFAV